jgi:hypothetical protein
MYNIIVMILLFGCMTIIRPPRVTTISLNGIRIPAKTGMDLDSPHHSSSCESVHMHAIQFYENLLKYAHEVQGKFS